MTIIPQVVTLFYYLIDLHYSQTVEKPIKNTGQFYYLIDLHYSQTMSKGNRKIEWFYYLIDLHYSQTMLIQKNLLIGFTTL